MQVVKLTVLHLLQLRRPSLFAVTTLGLTSGAWQTLEMAGVQGSIHVLLSLVIGGICSSFFLVALGGPLGWYLVYRTVKSTISTLNISQNTVLIGAGSGSLLAVGMLSKAMQEVMGRAPACIIFNLDYVDGRARISSPAAGAIPRDSLSDALIVFAHVGTGSALRELREHLGANTRAFAFQSKPDVREERLSSIITSSRYVLPWPQTL